MIKETNEELLAVLRKTALILSGDESRWDELPEMARHLRELLIAVPESVEYEGSHYTVVHLENRVFKEIKKLASWRMNYAFRR